MMLLASLLLISQSQIDPNAGARYDVFRGGTPAQFASFVLRHSLTNADVYATQVDPIEGVGPFRVLVQSGNNGKPPFTWMTNFRDMFELVSSKKAAALVPVRYSPQSVSLPTPVPILREEDAQTPPEDGAIGRRPVLAGEFVLGKGVPLLGFDVKVHGFFKDMRVYVCMMGPVQRDAWDAIAMAVGGKIVPGEKGSLRLVPDYPAIRKRALATIAYFFAGDTSTPSGYRTALRYRMLERMDSEAFKKLVDASEKVSYVPLTDPELVAAFQALARMRRSTFQAKKPEFAATIPDKPEITLVMRGHLGISVMIKGTDGSTIGL